MLSKNLIVSNMSALHALQNHHNGEMVYVEDTKEIWVWSDKQNNWIKFEAKQNGFELNLYDLNKSVVSQLTPMTMGEISAKMKDITNYYHKSNNTYHMLLCRDFNYYTIFNCNSMLAFPDFAGAVCTIITELGEVYSIEETNDGAMEIWIKPNGEEEPFVFYLFPYDAGVVYYG